VFFHDCVRICEAAWNEDQAAFMEKFGYTFRSLVGPNDKIKNLYNVNGIPTIVLIDQEGNIQMFDMGTACYDSLRETLRKWLRSEADRAALQR